MQTTYSLTPPLPSPITNFPFPFPALYFFSPLLVVLHAVDTPSHVLHLVRLGHGTGDADKEGVEEEEEEEVKAATNCFFTSQILSHVLFSYILAIY
jgi:hypothetical protein